MNKPVSFLLPTKTLEEALRLLKPYVPARSTMSVLQALRIEAKPNKHVILTVNDMESCVTYDALGTVFHGGELAVNFHQLAETVKAVKGSSTTIEVHESADNSRVAIKGAYSVPITCQPASDLPLVPYTTCDHMKTLILQAEALREGLSWVAQAISPDLTRPVLNTLNFHWDGVALTLQATDSYRLHSKEVEIVDCDLDKGNYMLPRDFIRAFAKQITHEQGPVGFGFVYDKADDKTPWGCIVTLTPPHNRMTWRSRVVEGQYPNVVQLTPAYSPEFVYCVLERSDFAGTMAAITKLAKKACPGPMRVAIEQVEGGFQATLSYEDKAGERSISQAVPIDVYSPYGTVEALPMTIGFDPHYLDAMLACRDRVGFQLISPLRPMVAHPDLDLTKQGLLMPIRLDD